MTLKNIKFFTLGILFLFLIGFIFAYQGSSSSYSGDIKQDSFAETNSSSNSFTQRLIGGVQTVGQYLTNSFSGRFGILQGVKNLAISIISHSNNQEVIRGGGAVAGEDDLDMVPNFVNFTAQVYENGTNIGFSGATCYFYDNGVLFGSSITNSSGHCTMNLTKSALSTGLRNLTLNYSILTSDNLLTSNSSINFSIIKYLIGLTAGNYRTSGCPSPLTSCYFNGDVATLAINVTKTNETGIFQYDPQNVTANGTNAAGILHTNGYSTYPGNITKINSGRYSANATVSYSAGTGAFIRWTVLASDNNLTSVISDALHADLTLCAGDFGAWSAWGACSGTTQTRTRSDSTSCSEVETQSCTPTESCFPAGTKILLSDGSYKNIEDIKVGEDVLSYSEINKENEVSKVLEIESPIRDHMCKIIFSDSSELNLTSEHPIYSKTGWKSINPEATKKEKSYMDFVEKLFVGDLILSSNLDYKEVKNISCWNETIQTYNLKSVSKNRNFYANDILAHNKGEGGCTDTDTDGYCSIASGGTDCNDANSNIHPGASESCSDGVDNNCNGNTDCFDGTCSALPQCQIQETICNDGLDNDNDGATDCADSDCSAALNCQVVAEGICNDGLDNDNDGATDCADSDCSANNFCTCIPDWKCDWTGCQEETNNTYYDTPINCVDLNNCNKQDNKPTKLLCELTDKGYVVSGVCLPQWDCSDWSDCSVNYDITNDLLSGQTEFNGRQFRTCSDLKDCKNETIEYKSCNLALPVSVVKTEWCYEKYIEVYDIQTNKLVSRIKDFSVRGLKKLEIGLIVSDFSGYCSYCYDRVQNYDEKGIDCGGSGCRPCLDKGSFFDLTFYIKLVLWILLLLLIIIFIITSRKELRETFAPVPEVMRERARAKARERVIARQELKSKVSLRSLISRLIPRIEIRLRRPEVRKPVITPVYETIKPRIRIPRRISPYSDLKKKLSGWQKKGYYVTSGLQRKLSNGISEYRNSRAEKRRVEEIERQRRKLEKIKIIELRAREQERMQTREQRENENRETRYGKAKGKSFRELIFGRRERLPKIEKHRKYKTLREIWFAKSGVIERRKEAKERAREERKAQREIKKPRKSIFLSITSTWARHREDVRKRKLERVVRKQQIRENKEKIRKHREIERQRRRLEIARIKELRVRERKIHIEIKKPRKSILKIASNAWNRYRENSKKRALEKATIKAHKKLIRANKKFARKSAVVLRKSERKRVIEHKFRLRLAKRLEKKAIRIKKRTERREIKIRRKEVRKHIRHIHKRIRRKEVNKSEVASLKRQLNEWHKKGYYDTTNLQRKLDEYK